MNAYCAMPGRASWTPSTARFNEQRASRSAGHKDSAAGRFAIGRGGLCATHQGGAHWMACHLGSSMRSSATQSVRCRCRPATYRMGCSDLLPPLMPCTQVIRYGVRPQAIGQHHRMIDDRCVELCKISHRGNKGFLQYTTKNV